MICIGNLKINLYIVVAKPKNFVVLGLLHMCREALRCLTAIFA
jgi:hypothetical protein